MAEASIRKYGATKMSLFGIVVGVLGSAAILLHTYSRSVGWRVAARSPKATDDIVGASFGVPAFGAAVSASAPPR